MIAFPVSVFALKFAVSATLITVLLVCVIELPTVTNRSPSFPATPVKPSASDVVSAPPVAVVLPSSIEFTSNRTISWPDAPTDPTKSLFGSSRTMSPTAVRVEMPATLTSSAVEVDVPSSTIVPPEVTFRVVASIPPSVIDPVST